MAEVRCSVNSCYYWDKGNICKADSIMVKNTLDFDVDDDYSPDMEIGQISPEPEMTERDGETARLDQEMDKEKDDMKQIDKKSQAKHSSDTCCETFRERDRQKY